MDRHQLRTTTTDGMQANNKAPSLGEIGIESGPPSDEGDGIARVNPPGTVLDDSDMHRMGKVQELKVSVPDVPVLRRFEPSQF